MTGRREDVWLPARSWHDHHMTSTPATFPTVEFYSWRVRKEVDGETRLVSDFDPMVDEFDMYELAFDTVDQAVEWLTDMYDDETDTFFDNFELVHCVVRHVAVDRSRFRTN